jgi:hypothetical protein
MEGQAMTDQAWLEERTHPQGMVWHLKGTPITRTKSGRRKLRLFACGCCRLIWPQLEDSRLRDAVEVAERFVDGNATATDLDAAGPIAHATIARNSRGFTEDDPNAQINTVVAMVVSTTHVRPFAAAFSVTAYPLPLAGHRGSKKEANALICGLLRDIFDNHFRKTHFDKKWRTDTTTALAHQMYESRDFGAMPILADALQDAGCDSGDILNHCRDANATHVRGCWVVDLVLGKE